MPAIRPGARGAVITGWGAALPPKVLTNDDLREMGLDTSDEWIRERTGIHQRHVGGTTAGLSVESARQALDRSGVDPAAIEAVILATTTPDRAVPATSATVQHELGLALRGLRRQRGLLRVRVRPRHRPRADRHGGREGARHRHRHAGPDHRLDGPQHRHPVRRRLGCGRARGHRRAGSAARLGPRRRRCRRALPLRRNRRHADHGRQGGVPTGGADHGRLGPQVDGPRRRDRGRPRHSSSPTRPTPASSRPPATASGSRWRGRRWCSSAPGTRPRPRSRWPWSTPSTGTASTRATSSSSSASAPG